MTLSYLFSDIKKLYVFLFIVLFAVCLEFTFDQKARNLLLIAFMGVSSLTLFFYQSFYKSDILLLCFVFCLLGFPILAHDNETRWSTIIYSCLFLTSFAAFMRALHVSNYSHYDFLTTLKFLLYAYCIVLIIQQVSVIVGLPPLNLRNYNALDPFKLNSLGAEPSWSGRIIALLFYCYITVKEFVVKKDYSFKDNFKEDKWVWFSFLWSMITMISGTAMVFLAIVLLKFVRLNKVFVIIPLFLVLIFVAENSHFKPYERARDVAIATLTLDEQKIIQADHSASFRIVPLINLIKSVDVSSFEGVFGHGVDSVRRNLDFNLGIVASSSSLVGLWYEFGFLVFLLFMCFSVRLCIDIKNPTSIIFWFMLVFLYGLNTQIPWLAIMLLFMTKKYSNKKFN